MNERPTRPERFGYKAWVLRIVDGDTLRLRVDLGFEATIGIDTRLLGINTPEVHTVKHESEEYEAGIAARDWVLAWLRENDLDGAGEYIEYEEMDDGLDAITPAVILIRSFDGFDFDTDKYGRWLAQVFGLQGPSLNEAIVAADHGTYKAY